MSNLGWYQSMTSCAKKCGGPLRFLATVAAGGYVIIRTAESGGKVIIKVIKRRVKSKEKVIANTYVVNIEGESNEGLKFAVGDQFSILEIAGDAVLIEKMGDAHNPYFVSADFLHSISNFNC